MPLFSPPSIEKMKAKGDIKGLLKAFHAHEQERVPEFDDVRRRLEAARALQALQYQPVDLAETASLAVFLEKWDQVVALGKIAVPTLLLRRKYTMVFGNPDKAIEALGRIGDRQAVMDLMWDLPLGDTLLDATAQAAFIALARIGAIEELHSWFKNRQDTPQHSALRLIRSLEEPLSIRLLMEVPTFWYIVTDLDKEIIKSLAELSPAAVESLIGYLSNENTYIARIAALALGKMKHPQARSLLRQRLNDPTLSASARLWIKDILG